MPIKKDRFIRLFIFGIVLSLNLHCGVTVSQRGTEDYVFPPTYQGRASRFLQDKSSATTETQVVYLNFDGQTINPGSTYGDDALTNSSFIVSSTVAFPAFDATPYNTDRNTAIAQVLANVTQIYSGFAVVFTTTRPSSGNYTMMMIGGEPGVLNLASDYIGYSPIDAGNQNPNDIGFVFASNISDHGVSLEGLSDCISHETAHTFGLVHITPVNDIMNATLEPGTLIWGVGPETNFPSATQNDQTLLQQALSVTAPVLTPAPVPPPAAAPNPVVKPAAPAPVAPTTPAPAAPGPALTANQTLVTNWYVKYLRRAPDSGGLATFSNELNSGMAANQVLSQILGAQEYFSKAGGTNLLFIKKLYVDVRGVAAPAAWKTNALAQLAKKPGAVGRTQIALQLLNR